MPPTTRRRNAAATKKRRQSDALRRAYARKATLPELGAGERYFALDVPFHDRERAAHYGVHYVQDTGWIWVGRRPPEMFIPWASKPHSWERWVQDSLNGRDGIDDPEPTFDTGKYTLRPDQIEDRDLILQAWHAGAPEVLIASDTGVGKTLTALAAVLALPNVTNVLVLAPLSVLANWRLHLRDAGTGGKRWCLINYESNKKLLTTPDKAITAKKAATKNKYKVAEGKSRVQWDVVITDESHFLANPTSQRSHVTEKMIIGDGAGEAFIIRISATAGDSPAKLAYLRRGLAFRTGEAMPDLSGDATWATVYGDWAQRHGFAIAAGPFGNAVKWDRNTDDLKRMETLLFGGEPRWAVRRKPEGWPEQIRVPVPIELDRVERAHYEQVWDEFQATMRELGRRMRAARAKGSVGDINKIQRAGAAAQIRYRQKAGLIRVPHVAEYVADLIEQGHQIPISCEFKMTVEALEEALTKKKLPPAIFTGVNASTRENDRIAFQRGERKVIIFSPAEGFNLHAGDAAVDGNDVPRTLVVAEPRWSPTKSLQIEGRAQRNGEAAGAHYTYALDTIEERVLKRNLEGVVSTLGMMGDDTASLTALAQEMGFELFGED